jgi:hypothetical protein
MTSGFRVERMTSVAPQIIYDRLADAESWSQWAPLVTRSNLIKRGAPDPLGAGAIRRVGGLIVMSVDEEILDATPPSYQRYTAVRGLPVRDYRGEVHLHQVGGGTHLVWTGQFEPLVPGTGRLLASLLRLAIGRIAYGVIAVCEQSVNRDT